MTRTITNEWHRYDPNDGWQPIPPCEAAAMLVDRIAPIALGNPGRAVGEELWERQGFRAKREALRQKLLELKLRRKGVR